MVSYIIIYIYGLQTVYNGQTEPFFSDVMVIGHSQTVVDYGWPHSPPTFFFVAKGLPAPVPTIQKTSHMKTRIDDGNVGRVPGRFKYRT